MKKKLSRNAPRNLPNGSWYYANPRSIEFVAYSSDLGSVISVLTERDLVQMLSELRPKRKKRTATKPRKRSER